MNIKQTKHLVFHIACMAAFALVFAFAFGSLTPQTAHADSNFYIDDYDIDMQVNEDDTYLITETLDVHFTYPSHGIYRVVPYKASLDRDGQQSTFYGRVRDFQMLSGQPVKKQKGDTAYYFKIGDKDEYAPTDTTYRFSYVFDMKGDHLDGADEVYYNLIGTAWEAQSINHVTFRVTFPKDIDMSKVGMKTGYQVDVPFETEGNRVVTGDTYENTMTGLTIRAVLPEGYFTKQASTSNLLIFLLLAALAAVTAAGFVFWRRYGIDPKIVETEEFYPPKGMSAPEVAYLEEGSVSGKQITSLLLTLADMGCLKITEMEVPYGRKKKKTRTDYEITKLKNPDNTLKDGKAFMDGLFKDGDSVMMSDLEDSFYKTVNEIKEAITSRYEELLYDKKAAGCATVLRGIGIAGMIAMFAVFKLLNGSPFIVGHGDFVTYLVVDAFEIALPLGGLIGIASWISRPRKSPFSYILGFAAWGFLVVAGLGLAVIFDTCMGAQIILYIIGLGILFLLFVMASLCERKTDYYAEMLGKIRGYKQFLKIAEKDRMEALAESDPNYFYRNLAFAFALGVTSVYAKRFASLATQPPDWYYGGNYEPGTGFDSTSMMDSMDSMMSSVSSAMTSSPSDSGGGGSFSGGGGAGGGGGGSW